MLDKLKTFANKPAVKETLIMVATAAATIGITIIALEVAKTQSDYICNKIVDVLASKE